MQPGRLPTFEPDRDGNPYLWVVAQSQAIRARSNNDAQCIRLERALHERHQNGLAAIAASSTPVAEKVDPILYCVAFHADGTSTDLMHLIQDAKKLVDDACGIHSEVLKPC